jgi:hypothetical protein
MFSGRIRSKKRSGGVLRKHPFFGLCKIVDHFQTFGIEKVLQNHYTKVENNDGHISSPVDRKSFPKAYKRVMI